MARRPHKLGEARELPDSRAAERSACEKFERLDTNAQNTKPTGTSRAVILGPVIGQPNSNTNFRASAGKGSHHVTRKKPLGVETNATPRGSSQEEIQQSL